MGVILIAFERESEQTAIEQLLAGRGHRVVRSANGLAALDTARRDPPHAVVSDIVLPRMDGFALCRKWKQDERLQSIPFLFYTRRHDDPKYERFALELGAERFLARSVAPEALLKALDELLAEDTRSSSGTMPMPALNEGAIKHAAALEQAQQAARADAAEKIRQAQQAARAEAAEKIHQAEQAARAEAAEKIQQAEQAARAEGAEKIQQAEQAQARLRAQLADVEAAKERLAAGEARFRRVFEANPLPMWIADQETGGYIAVNDAALALYGYARSEFLALQSSALEMPGASDANASNDTRAHRRKDGTPLTIGLAAMQIEFDGRNADLVCASDLTERVRTERQLRENAGAARAILDAAADGCWILDGEGRLLDVNPAYCHMSGYAREELLRMNVADIEDQSAGETTQRLQLGRVRGGGRYETKHRRPDGTLLHVEVTVGPMEGARGDSLVLIRDVSQRRRDLIAQRSTQRQLEFLVDLSKQSGSFDESAIVRRLIEQVAEVTSSPLAFLYFADPARKTIVLVAWLDRGEFKVAGADVEAVSMARAGLFAECVRAKRATSSNDPARKSQQDGLPDLHRYLAVPMLSDDETMAILGVGNRDAAYNEDDQRMLASLADGVWRMLQAKRMHAQTLRSLQRTDVALQGMIDSMVRMSERHDPYTAGSARRLAALAVALGREAGLDGERQHALRVAALLHDVGNIAVPASILAKPAALTQAEVALMRSHVEEGCKLLAEIDFGAPVADIIYQSHERCDGSGYPRGLKGDEILVEARILAIADTVEAMCSPRPYRPARGIDAAIDEINRGAGRVYDLHLVAACTRLFRQRGFVLPE